MRKTNWLGAALGIAAVVATASGARAGALTFCFESMGKDKRFLQSAGSHKPYFANATECAGKALITIGDANRIPATTPRIGTPVYLYSHEKRFLLVSKGLVRGPRNSDFELEVLIPGSGFNEWNQFVLQSADPKTKKGTPLKAGMTFHIVPKLARERFKVLSADTLKDWNGAVSAYQAFVASPSTTFRLVTAGPAQPGSPAWSTYGGPFAPPRIYRDGDLVTVTGLVKGSWTEHVWSFPGELAPRQRLIFNTNNADRSARVDVVPGGKVSYHAGGRYEDWLSLAGIQYSLKAAEPAKLRPGWTPFSNEYAPPSYSKQGSLVSVQGLAKGKGRDLFQLPPGYRPKQRLIFNMNNHDASYRLDIHSNGVVQWNAGGKKHGWLSLSGITFDTEPGKALELARGWGAYGKGYAGPAASKTGKTVVVSGLVRHAKSWSPHIATLPADMRPPQILVFSANNHDGQTRLNVLPDGRIFYAGGQRKHGWISLTGITFATK